MSSRPSRIIALGGGGFSMEPGNPLLDDALLEATGVDHPRVLFIPTASGDQDSYILRFYEAFAAKAAAAHLPLFRRKHHDLASLVFDHQLVFVGGGNTANLLAVWRVHGLDRVLCEAYHRGIVLSGVSAGAMCWFEGGVTDSFGTSLEPLRDGLGLLAGGFCPHYDGESERAPALDRLVASGALPACFGVDDGAAVDFVDGEVHRVITSRESSRAFRVELVNQSVTRIPLVSTHLGAAGTLTAR